MIKASAQLSDGRTLLILGLSSKNLEKLRERKPAMIDLTEFGLKGELVLMWGETEAQIFEEFKQAGVIGADTVIHRGPRT